MGFVSLASVIVPLRLFCENPLDKMKNEKSKRKESLILFVLEIIIKKRNLGLLLLKNFQPLRYNNNLKRPGHLGWPS